MEFNILPRARILCPHHAQKYNTSTNQTVNVILNEKATEGETDTGAVEYKTRDISLNETETPEPEAFTNSDTIASINFLKLVLESYLNNPIKYNGYIICSVPLLEQLIETISSCDDCSVEVADFDIGCCSKCSHIVPITKIWVKNKDSTEVFKYKYSELLQVFEQYHISLKFVYVE